MISGDTLIDFCRRHHIQRLALFGSVLRDDFRSDSDVDVLVEFLPGERVGLIRLGTVEAELSDLLGRAVDLSLMKSLNPHFRDEVLRAAQTIYDAA
jgi:predicted nucleotidyltransferase